MKVTRNFVRIKGPKIKNTGTLMLNNLSAKSCVTLNSQASTIGSSSLSNCSLPSPPSCPSSSTFASAAPAASSKPGKPSERRLAPTPPHSMTKVPNSRGRHIFCCATAQVELSAVHQPYSRLFAKLY